MAPKVPSVENCCCYFELRTGALILGWLDLVGSVLAILGAFTSLVSENPEQERIVFVIGNNQQVLEQTSIWYTILEIVILAILLPLTVWFLRGIYEVGLLHLLFDMKSPFFFSSE